jgi:hypothetical protein
MNSAFLERRVSIQVCLLHGAGFRNSTTDDKPQPPFPNRSRHSVNDRTYAVGANTRTAPINNLSSRIFFVLRTKIFERKKEKSVFCE